MSYCRMGDNSDVYVIAHASNFSLCCLGCRMGPPRTGPYGQYYEDKHLYCSKDMIDHLKAHKKVGHKVPKRAIDRLEAEQVNTDNWIRKHFFIKRDKSI